MNMHTYNTKNTCREHALRTGESLNLYGAKTEIKTNVSCLVDQLIITTVELQLPPMLQLDEPPAQEDTRLRSTRD